MKIRIGLGTSSPQRTLQAKLFSLPHRCSSWAVSGQSLQRLPSLPPEIRNRCTQEVVNGHNLAAILKSGLEIKNRCTQERVNRQNPASILKFGLEIKNRCTKERVNGKTLHRFSSLGLKSRIDAALGSRTASVPGSRTAAVPWRVPYTVAGKCRMGRDFGRRSRPWLREREGPAAQRREGKHRRCAPVRSPCPQADSDAETRSLPAGRLGCGNASLSPSGCLIC